MTTRRNVPPDIQQMIEDYALSGWKATRIQRHLMGDDTVDSAEIPSKRTIQRTVSKMNPPDPSGRWELLHKTRNNEDTRAVLEALTAVVEHSAGHLDQITNAEAERIARLRGAAPDMPPWTSFELARRYLAREAAEQPTQDLDFLVAFAPWQDDGHQAAYNRAIARRWVVGVQGFIDVEGVADDVIKVAALRAVIDALAEDDELSERMKVAEERDGVSSAEFIAREADEFAERMPRDQILDKLGRIVQDPWTGIGAIWIDRAEKAVARRAAAGDAPQNAGLTASLARALNKADDAGGMKDDAEDEAKRE